MNTNRLPYGAVEIDRLRRQGKRPADMVLVSLIGPLNESNPIILVRTETRYDWRFLTDLEVLVVVDSKIEPEAILKVLEAIGSVKPSYLGVWFADKQNGRHLAFGSWKPKTQGARWMSPADRQQFAGVGGVQHAND